MKVMQKFGNYNPSGITIYPGWYALAACLICNMTVEESIAIIVYGQESNAEVKPRKKPNKRAEICKAYRQGVKDYQKLANRFGCSKRYVWLSLTKKGVVQKKDFYFKFCDLMEHEPSLTQKEVAKKLGCGLSSVSRFMRRWSEQNKIGYLGGR